MSIPIVTIDGPSGSGKGTLARQVAGHLGWNFLDSGALYRILAHATEISGLAADDEEALAAYAKNMPVSFGLKIVKGRALAPVLLDGQDISQAIRTETCGALASQIATLPAVREALSACQQYFRQPPGLVADGRDMGTEVFPDAQLKLYLEASAQERAKRRHDQLKASGLDANLGSLLEEIEARDHRDKNRAIAPLRPADDAIVVDTTNLGIPEVYALVLSEVRRVFGAA